MKLAKREKLFIASGAIFLGLFLLIVGIINPLLYYRKDLGMGIAKKEAQLKKVYEITSEIKTLRRSSETFGKSSSDANFTLFAFLEGIAGEIGVKDNIDHMKPVTAPGDTAKELVELKIKGMSNSDLVRFLEKVEGCAHPLVIKRFNLKRNDRDKTLDMTLQVAFYGG